MGRGYLYTKNSRDPRLLVSLFYIDRSDYQVMDTDYVSYAIIRACTDYSYGLLHSELFWIFQRSSTPDPTIIANAKQTIKDRAPHYDIKNL